MSYIPVQYVQSCSKYVSSNFSRFDASTFNKTTIIQLQTGTIGHLTQHYLEHVFVSYNVFFHYCSRDFFCVPSTFSFLLIRLLPVKLKGTISLSLSKLFCYGLVIDLKLALQLYSESRNYKSSSSLFRAVLTIA